MSHCALMAALLVAGCAGQPSATGYSLASGDTAPPAPNAPLPSASVTPPAGYVFSDEEKQLDCRRLTGRMKIRIIQIRDYESRTKTSELSRSMQAAQGQFGGSLRGIDPDSEHARDRAMLAAYNSALAEKGCKTLDLAAELRPQTATATSGKP